MTSQRELTIQKAKTKGNIALGVGAGSIAVTAIAFSIGTIIGLIALVGTGFFTWKKLQEWLEFRGKWGIRF